MATHRGSCHCGAVRFEIEADLDEVVLCDCSVCTKKGVINAGVAEADFRLLAGADALSLYRFGSGTACHHFCRHCGIHPFSRPRMDPSRYAVNVRCLDDFDAIMARARQRRFDGRNHPKDRAADPPSGAVR